MDGSKVMWSLFASTQFFDALNFDRVDYLPAFLLIDESWMANVACLRAIMFLILYWKNIKIETEMKETSIGLTESFPCSGFGSSFVFLRQY